MAFDVTNFKEAPTNPELVVTGYSTSTDRLVCAILPDDSTHTNITYEYLGGTDTDYATQATTEGYRLKCYDALTTDGLQFNPTDFATRNYYVLINSDFSQTHHFAKIKEIHSDDVTGDSLEFEPKLGNEIPKGTKFRIIKGELKTVDIIALTAGIKRNLSSSLIVARPIFYFKDGLDKKNELDHNTKYFASIHGGTITSFELNGSSSQDTVFRTVQDFGNSVVDYSKYSLKVTLTDILRQLDNDTTGSITDNEDRSFTFDADDYDDVFPNARREVNDSIISRNLTGATRYVHYDYSPTKANIAYGVFRHENTESIGGKGGFSESSIMDNNRIMAKKIQEFDDYRVRHRVHDGDIDDWFALEATFQSESTPSNYIFETQYDLGTVFNVGDELKLDDKILVVDTIGTLSGTTQTITFRTEIRTASTGIFLPDPTFTPTANSILYRRAYNPTDKTLMLNMDLIDSRFSKLYVMLFDKNLNELFATVTACDETKKMITLSLSEDSYTGDPLEYASGQYSVFVERFNGEIEEIEVKKEQGQTIFEIRGRDKFNKLLSPIINKNTLFSEDVIYSSNSPYNKLGLITSATYSLSIGDTELNTQTTLLSFTNLPAIGDKLFSSKGYIGEVTNNTRTSGSNVVLDFTASMVELSSENVYVDTEKNYILTKSLGVSHLAISPTSLTGSANKGVIFTSGQIIDIGDGSEDGTLIGTSNNDNPEAVGYSINSPSHVSLDRNFQARLKDEFGDNTFSTFDTVNTLMDFEVVSRTKKGNLTELEIAPYLPITLGRKVNYHFDTSDYTFTSLGTVVTEAGLNTRGDFFVSVNGTEAYNLEVGDNIFVQANGSTTKKFVGQLVNTEIVTVGATVETYIILDRDVHAFVATSGSEDTLYKGVKPTNDIAFINGKHLWGGKIVTVPHPKSHSTHGSVPLNVENPNGTLDYIAKHGQMYYKSTGMIYGNFDINTPPININIVQSGVYPNKTIPILYKDKSLLNYYTSNYQIKPNTGSTNFTNFDTTDSSYRTFALDMRGHTSPFGSNSTNVRIHKTDLSNLIVRFYNPLLINTFLQTDMSALRLFLYVNSDLLPYSKLRNDSLSGKTLTNYNIYALENKETKDKAVANGNRLRLKDNNFQTLSFSSEQNIGDLTQFGLMRLTEVCFDVLFNPVNPEKPITKVERAYDIQYTQSDTLQGDPEVYDITVVVPTVHSLSGTTLTFSSDASSYTAVGEYIYDADNGNFVGKIASKTSNTVWELESNGFFTRNGSAPLNVVSATITRADFYGRALQDTYEDFSSDNKRAIHLLKCVINPEYSNYGKEYGSANDGDTELPSETEIVLPFAISGSEYSVYSTADCHMVRPMKNIFNTGNYGFDGMIGVVLDTFEVEDGRHKEAKIGDTTQVLKGNGILEITADSGRMPTMLSDSHFKSKDNPDDDASTTAVDHTSAPFPVDGAFMVFKPRLWTGTISGGDRSTPNSSNGTVHQLVTSVSNGDNRFLDYIDLTGCYLVPEAGTKLDDTTITTGGEYSSNRMTDVMPSELIYVISHEVDDSTITDHILITDVQLSASTGYRILQPNEVCMHDFFPREIYMNTLRPSYTKVSNRNETYKFESSYFYEEGTISSGQNTVENEGVLSMFVAIDLDRASTDDGIVIKNRENFFDNVLEIGNHNLYFSDGDNSKKITITANQNYSFTLSSGFYGKGVLSVSEPFTISSREELEIDPDRLVIGTTVSIGLEAEDLINDLLEENGIDFSTTQNDYPYYLAPNYKGMDLYSAIRLILDRKDMTLIEENGTFKITPEDDSTHYNNITINDSGDFQIYEFEQSSSLFDFYNDIIVYGRTHKSNRKDLRSIQKRGRKTLEVIDDTLITQSEVDRKSLQLLLLHSQFNKKIRFTMSSTGINQIRAGDLINVEIPRENIELAQYIVLEVRHELTGLISLELGRFSKDLSDLFSEILLANKETKSFLRSNSFDEKASTYNFLEEVKLKELRLLVRKRTTTGAYRIGFDATLGTTTNTIGFNGGTVTTTTLIDEDLA